MNKKVVIGIALTYLLIATIAFAYAYVSSSGNFGHFNLNGSRALL